MTGYELIELIRDLGPEKDVWINTTGNDYFGIIKVRVEKLYGDDDYVKSPNNNGTETIVLE
jgi:hypothetical protein